MKANPPRILTRDLIADTLAMMALIDRTDEFAECYLWKGSTTNSGHPTYKPFGKPCTLVRRAIYELSGGVLERRVPLITTCGEPLCINPAHIKPSTTAAVAKLAAKRGAWSGKARAAKIAAAKRATAKLDMEIARLIRLSDETGPVLAQRYGVNRSVITGIKAGTRWRDFSNPWGGLM